MSDLEKHDVWMSLAMVCASQRALDERRVTDHEFRVRVDVPVKVRVIEALADYANDCVKLTYEEADVLTHVCAEALASVTALWMEGDAKDDNRRYAQQLTMVIGQLTKSNGRW